MEQSHQDCTGFDNVGFLSVGEAIWSHEHLMFAQDIPGCDAFHLIRMLRFQLELQLELHLDARVKQFLRPCA